MLVTETPDVVCPNWKLQHIKISVRFSSGVWCCFRFMLVFNLLVSRECFCDFRIMISKLISRIDILSISCEITLIWKPRNLTDDKSMEIAILNQGAMNHLKSID